MTQVDRGDPEREVYEAVAELEKKKFTRREIARALDSVAADIAPDGTSL